MIRTLSYRHFHWLAVLLVLTLLQGCGWAEWPPPENGPQSSNRPIGKNKPQITSGSGALFTGASAVIVGKGDSVYALSKRHGVSTRAIIEANNLKPPYRLRIGQRIILPRARVYTVRRGDTLSEIAQGQNVDMYALARANGLKPPYVIRIGQKLRLPGVSGTQVAVAPRAPVVKDDPPPKRKPITAKTAQPRKSVAPPPPRTGKGFLWPVRGPVLSSFGTKAKGLHNDGINIKASRGAPVVASENGVVAYAGNELRGFGNLLLIKHSGGWVTAYAHNDALLVKRGDKVKKGQRIAKVGSSGSVKSPQLHFELRKGKRAVDPLKYMPKPSV